MFGIAMCRPVDIQKVPERAREGLREPTDLDIKGFCVRCVEPIWITPEKLEMLNLGRAAAFCTNCVLVLLTEREDMNLPTTLVETDGPLPAWVQDLGFTHIMRNPDAS